MDSILPATLAQFPEDFWWNATSRLLKSGPIRTMFQLLKDDAVAPIPETPSDFDHPRIIERPDGYYWLDDKEVEYGPFPTILEAIADMEFNASSEYEPGETTRQAENEIGVSEWIDPETGAPAEDGTLRIEDDH